MDSENAAVTRLYQALDSLNTTENELLNDMSKCELELIELKETLEAVKKAQEEIQTALDILQKNKEQ